jgi:hypothetical protein
MAMLGCSLQSSTADAISSTLHDTDTLTQPTNNTKNSTKKILIYKTIKAAPLYLYVTYYFYRLQSLPSFNCGLLGFHMYGILIGLYVLLYFVIPL